MAIQLSDHFNYKRLLKFVFPSIIMMVFTSVYGVVDGLFVSNYVGKTAFAAINLIMPMDMIFGGVGFMLGYVPQKGVLFSGTIDSNLRYGREEATEEEVKQAARIAQAWDFISEKPEGLQSPIAQGGTNVRISS